MNFSDRVLNLTPSATLAVSQKAAALKSQGFPVISFGTGEPDFAQPQSAYDAALKAMDDHQTHYTAVAGINELRTEVSNLYKRRFNLDYQMAEVTVASGAKPVIYSALASVVNPGDQVILIAPAFVSYPEQVKAVGGVPVFVDSTQTGYIPDPKAVEAAITPKTKALLLNTPNNPSGMVYPAHVLKAIAQLAIEHDFLIINDEIYADLVYDGAYQHILNACPECRDRVVNVHGVSKSYAMTGWRIGFGVGPAELISKMTAILGHVNGCSCSIAQHAALGALKGADDDVESMKASFAKRRQLALDLLNKIPGLKVVEPQGAFYILFDVQQLLGRRHEQTVVTTDAELAADLLAKKYVAFTPGSAFFAPGSLRLSYASSEDDIRNGLARLAEYVSQLTDC